MKALDTPVLLRLLHGDERVRSLLRSLPGEELATTEWNLLELEIALRADARPGRERRRAALDQLRRRLTVLPIDEAALRSAREIPGQPRSPSEMIELGLLSALQARGCEELYTTRGRASGRLRSRVRVRVV